MMSLSSKKPIISLISLIQYYPLGWTRFSFSGIVFYLNYRSAIAIGPISLFYCSVRLTYIAEHQRICLALIPMSRVYSYLLMTSGVIQSLGSSCTGTSGLSALLVVASMSCIILIQSALISSATSLSESDDQLELLSSLRRSSSLQGWSSSRLLSQSGQSNQLSLSETDSQASEKFSSSELIEVEVMQFMYFSIWRVFTFPIYRNRCRVQSRLAILRQFLCFLLRRLSQQQSNCDWCCMHKFLAFMGVCGLGGLTYLKYYEYSKINRDLEQLIERNELSTHLYQINEDSAFSIDSTMDSFERGYNQFSINKYRETLAGLCEGKVLETCAGSNRNLKFYKPGIDLTLIDFSPNMVSTGSAKLSPFLQYNYVLGDVMAMNFKDNEFDCVLDTFGLQYVLNPHKALSQIRRVCKKDGRILLMNEGISGIVEFHYWQNIKWGYNLMRGGYFSNRNWQKLIKQFDFEVEHLQKKKNGKLYIFVLRNVKKEESESKPAVV